MMKRIFAFAMACFGRIPLVRMPAFLVLGACLSSRAAEDSTGIHFKYNYFSAPQYSTDGLHYVRTRNEFSFKSFYPEFRELYGNKYGYEPLDKAESRHMWATLIGIPGGVLLGLGLGQMVFHNEEGPAIGGMILSAASIPFLWLSVEWDIDSFHIIRDGRR